MFLILLSCYNCVPMGLDNKVKNLPKYTFRDEIWNSITHGIGFLFSLGVLIYFIVINIVRSIPFTVMAPYYFYVFSMMLVFTISTLYHSSKFSTKYRAIMRIIDHSDIYLFCAGTYFPICMFGVMPHNVGIALVITQFALATFGILTVAIPNNSKVLKALGYACYIVEGWILIFFLPFGVTLNFAVFLFVLIGGIIYTIGAIIYAIGKKKIWLHTVFHVFVVLGAVLQFIGIYYLINL